MSKTLAGTAHLFQWQWKFDIAGRNEFKNIAFLQQYGRRQVTHVLVTTRVGDTHCQKNWAMRTLSTIFETIKNASVRAQEKVPSSTGSRFDSGDTFRTYCVSSINIKSLSLSKLTSFFLFFTSLAGGQLKAVHTCCPSILVPSYR